ATLIKTPSGQLVVIDGGPSPTSLNAAVGRALPFYQREVALVVLTRVTDEKLTGLVSMLERYNVGQVIEPDSTRKDTALRRWRELISQKTIPTQSALAGMQLDLGDGVLLEVVSAGKDDEGLALRLRYGVTSVFFDNDAERGEAPDENAQVLRVGRHGDAKTARAEFLQALAPQFAIISVGKDNRSNDPAESTLARLNDAGVIVYRTDQHGTIEFNSDGETWWAETAR
ncbi:MAG: hypothetical protein LC737_06050, partial [Chloroflexi bacterium]|nr:hypothetical protein [Chloroflexota bacterium]